MENVDKILKTYYNQYEEEKRNKYIEEEFLCKQSYQKN